MARFTMEDLRRAWLLERLKDPTMKHDPDSSDADDEFAEIMAEHDREVRKVAGQGWSAFLGLLMDSYLDDQDREAGVSLMHHVVNSSPELAKRFEKALS